MKFYLIIIFLAVSINQFIYPQWIPQNSGTASELFDVFFLDNQTGFSAGDDGKFIRTTTGGNFWDPVTVNPGIFINGMFFVNNLTGFISCKEFLFPPYYHYVYKTTNRGVNWTVSFNADSSRTAGIYFINNNTGFFGASYCDTRAVTRIYRTTNQNLWNLIYSANSCYINTMKFINNYGFWTGATNGNVYKTTNFGSSWIVQNVGYADILYDLHMFNKDTVIICGQTGKIFITTNGGTNWSPISSGTSYDLVSISFPDIYTGYIQAESNNYLKTTNGGMTWLTYNTGNNNVMHSIYFIDALTGYTVGRTGTILKTTTGGTIAIEPISNEIPEHFELLQNYPNPFNPSTIIHFNIPLSRGVNAEGGRGVLTKLIIYDILGREISMPVNENLKPGIYEVDWNAANYPSGVYFYRLIADYFMQTKKMTLVK